jgi:Na+-driven multidrug efflux pump
MLAIVLPRLRADGLRRLRIVPAVMWEVVRVGAHLVQRTAFLLAALAVATAAASGIGPAELAGHQIAAQLFLVLAIGVDMFKVAGQALVGHALGAGDRAAASDVVDHLRWWAWRAGLVLGVGVLAASPWAPHVFSQDPAARRAASTALVVLAVMQLPAAFTFVYDGVLMGANDFRNLRWQTTVAFAAALPVLAAVRFRPSLGIATVWLGLLVWMLVRAAWNVRRVASGQWMSSASVLTPAAPRSG